MHNQGTHAYQRVRNNRYCTWAPVPGPGSYRVHLFACIHYRCMHTGAGVLRIRSTDHIEMNMVKVGLGESVSEWNWKSMSAAIESVHTQSTQSNPFCKDSALCQVILLALLLHLYNTEDRDRPSAVVKSYTKLDCLSSVTPALVRLQMHRWAGNPAQPDLLAIASLKACCTQHSTTFGCIPHPVIAHHLVMDVCSRAIDHSVPTLPCHKGCHNWSSASDWNSNSSGLRSSSEGCTTWEAEYAQGVPTSAVAHSSAQNGWRAAPPLAQEMVQPR